MTSLLPPAPPTLGVFFPNYNHRPYLRQSLGAMFRQLDYIDHLLVIDDGTTDGSQDLIREIAAPFRDNPRLEILFKPENKGIFDSHRIALEKIATSFFYSAAADDYVLDGFFQESLALLADHPEAGLCFSNAWQLEASSGRFFSQDLDLGPQPRFISPEEFRVLLKKRENFLIPPHSTILNRAALAASGGFESRLKWHADWFTYNALALRHGFGYLPARKTVFRLLPTAMSSMHDKSTARKRQERDGILSAFLDIVAEPRNADVRAAFRLPPLLELTPGTRCRLFRKSLRKPSRWWFPSLPLLVALARDTIRKPLWNLLWPILKNLGPGKRPSSWRIAALRFFGATVEGIPSVRPGIAIDRPWNLALGDGAFLSHGVKIQTGDARVEIGAGALIERDVSFYASGWDERSQPPCWITSPIRIGSGAFVGPQAVLLSGTIVEPNAAIPPGTVVRGLLDPPPQPA